MREENTMFFNTVSSVLFELLYVGFLLEVYFLYIYTYIKCNTFNKEKITMLMGTKKYQWLEV